MRIGPWVHGECREGGFPDWLIDKAYGWANGDAKTARQLLRSSDERFLSETKKLFDRVSREVAPHLWKNGGPVVGVQLENESPGPWPYYQALKRLAVETGYDVPMYTRTGWPRLNGPETTFGEMIPLYGGYAEGFWDREPKSMPGRYKEAFLMRPVRTSTTIATEQLGKQKPGDANGVERYPYFTLPSVSYEFMAPISEFGEPQQAYWMIKALADFCRENAEELAVADPVFTSEHETRRGKFVFHNDYVRRLRPDGECWIGVEKDGIVEHILDGKVLTNADAQRRREGVLALRADGLKCLKPAGIPPPIAIGPNGVATPPEESAWDAAAEYEVPVGHSDAIIEISYEGDMARLYADGKLVQDDFWKGRPIRYALRRLPPGTKSLVLKVLPWAEGAKEMVFVDIK